MSGQVNFRSSTDTAVDQGLAVLMLQGWGDRGGGPIITQGLRVLAVQRGDEGPPWNSLGECVRHIWDFLRGEGGLPS